ncbi:MAG: hypothetical protein U0R76_09720 [Candidatus Nanopelagicales bacterium]
MVTNAIRSAQTQVESQNFEIRKNVLKYDEVMNRQRVVIYEERRRVLEGEDLHEQVRGFLDDTVKAYVEAETSEGYPEDWDYERLWTALGTLYPVGVSADEIAESSGGGYGGITQEYLVGELQADAQAAYDEREKTLGPDVMRELERRVVLSVLDRKWREHLYEMDYLQEGIGLRAYSQKDPLVEYQREGFELFQAMMDAIKEESVGYLFNVEVQVEDDAQGPALTPTVAPEFGALAQAAQAEPSVEAVLEEPAADAPHAPAITAKGLGPQRPQRLEYSAPTIDGEAGVAHKAEELDEVPEVGPDASRAERRRAERAQRKRDERKR